MKHLFLVGGLSSLSVLASAQQKDLFDINRHLKGNKQFSIPNKKSFQWLSNTEDPNRLMMKFRTPNGDGIYSQSVYRMPVIVPTTDLSRIPNPGLSKRLSAVILGWPGKSITGVIPNPAPLMSL